MAESDPKKIRPLGQTSDRRNLDSEEDPLVELARIVSEDTGFYGSRTDRAKAQREDPLDRNAYSADLESELLQELESSFSRPSPARGHAAAPFPAAPQSVAREPSDDADDLLRSIEKQLGEFERRNQTRSAPASAQVRSVEQSFDPFQGRPPQNQVEDENLAPDLDDYGVSPEDEGPSPEEQERAFAEARDREMREREARELAAREAAQREVRERRAAAARERAAAEGVERQARERAAAEAREREVRERTLEEARERIAGVRGSDPAKASGQPSQSRSEPRSNRLAPLPERDDADDRRASVRLPLRRRDPPMDGRPGLAAGAAGGWNEIDPADEVPGPPLGEQERLPASEGYRGQLRTTFGGLDEVGQSARPAAAELDPIEAEIQGELEPSYSDPAFGTPWPDSPDTAEAAYADDPQVAAVPPPSGRGHERAERQRSRAPLLAAAGVLALVVVGGAAAMFMRSGEDVSAGPPPVIAAPEGDVKVAPQAQAETEGETVGEAVYNRVAGNAPPAEEQVVDGAEEPREISRIVLPPPQENADEALARPVGGDAPAGAAESPAAPAEGVSAESAVAAQPAGPRRVRTYVVRPDGTITETQAAAEAADGAPAQEQQVAAATQSSAEPIVPVQVPTTEIDGTGQPPAVEPDPLASTPAAEPPAPEMAAVQPGPERVAPAPAEPAAPVDALSAAPPPAEAAAPAAAPSAASADGYVVQISSQRSMNDAQSSWATAKSRYGSVLGNMEPNIQEADLGAKGIFYRVRVGPWPSRAEAVQVCESLRAAGGDCIVTR